MQRQPSRVYVRQVTDQRRTGTEIITHDGLHGTTTVLDAHGHVLAHYDPLGEPLPRRETIVREVDDSSVVVATVAIMVVALAIIFWPSPS